MHEIKSADEVPVAVHGTYFDVGPSTSLSDILRLGKQLRSKDSPV